MNVILLENMKTLGNLGDSVIVKAGFARNYLLPKGKAVRASKENIAYFESEKAAFVQKAQEKLAEAKNRLEKLDNLHVTIRSLAGDEGKLYGSVGINEIVAAIVEQGIELHKQEVQLPDGPFRAIGTYPVQLYLLHGEVVANISITIVAEDK
jgi:large subunit ribosomal protein L9